MYAAPGLYMGTCGFKEEKGGKKPKIETVKSGRSDGVTSRPYDYGVLLCSPLTSCPAPCTVRKSTPLEKAFL